MKHVSRRPHRVIDSGQGKRPTFVDSFSMDDKQLRQNVLSELEFESKYRCG
jgi:hypothetical protein